MDYLAASGLEPQLAIPVIVVVVGALLVYVFGFQKSEEPSMEHLAVLQSTSSYKTRSVSNTKPKNASAPSKAKEKASQNGHVVQDKERNGVASKKKEPTANNKENKPPRTPQIATSSKKVKQEVLRPEDFDSGEWIQAVSRKDKKKQVKKDEPKENQESPKKEQPKKEEKEVVGHNEETVLKEAQVQQVQIQNQTTQTTPKPTPEKKSKKAGKDVSTTTSSSGPSSEEASPAKQKPQPAKQEKQAPEVVSVNGVAEPEKASPEASPAKKLSVSEDAPVENEAKGRVAFDEMGDQNVDAWEEAKSRGNKKRRARKD